MKYRLSSASAKGSPRTPIPLFQWRPRGVSIPYAYLPEDTISRPDEKTFLPRIGKRMWVSESTKPRFNSLAQIRLPYIGSGCARLESCHWDLFRASAFGSCVQLPCSPAALPGIIGAVKLAASAKPSLSPTKQIAGFIAKFDPEVARLIRQCRAEVRKLLPTAVELVYDNYNFLVFGFATTERASDALISIAAASNGVGLCFIHGASLPDPQRILLGSGKQTRFIRLPTIAPLRSPAVSALLRAAVSKAARPLPAKGGGYTVIKSISLKQRPRRRVPVPGHSKSR